MSDNTLLEQTKISLTLFVSGYNVRSERAKETLLKFIESYRSARFELTIVDVLEHPQEAAKNKILATPTVVKDHPPPVRRIVGDLSDAEMLISGLDIQVQHPES